MRENCKMDVEKESFWTITPIIDDMKVLPPFVILEAGEIFARECYSAISNGEKGYLLLYTVSGQGTLVYGGQRQSLRKGEAAVLDCECGYACYTSKNPSENWVFYYIHFSGASCEFYTDMLSSNQKSKTHIGDKIGFVSYLDAFFSSLKAFDTYHRCIQAGVMCQILTQLVCEQDSKKGTEKSSYENIESVHDIVDFIDKNHWQPLDLDMLAKDAGISKYHFAHIFKAIMGVSPYKYLTTRRIEEAKKILKTTDMSVYSVSMMVGFKNDCHFSRMFKSITNMTPLQYRKS